MFINDQYAVVADLCVGTQVRCQTTPPPPHFLIFQLSSPLDITQWEAFRFYQILGSSSTGYCEFGFIDSGGKIASKTYELPLGVWEPLMFDYTDLASWTIDGGFDWNNVWEIAFWASCTMTYDSMLIDFPHFTFAEPVCAMKTETDGYFYVPNVASGLLKVEMLFDNSGIEGDQTGAGSPYDYYPDGYVNYLDAAFIGGKFGSSEGDAEWDYMADVHPDTAINYLDSLIIGKNFGNHGTYITDLSGVTVAFNTGEETSPDSGGFVTIPQGATNFTVKQDGNPIGAMVIFW